MKANKQPYDNDHESAYGLDGKPLNLALYKTSNSHEVRARLYYGVPYSSDQTGSEFDINAFIKFLRSSLRKAVKVREYHRRRAAKKQLDISTPGQ